jgi:integral membrane protein (TIGR01906 family)
MKYFKMTARVLFVIAIPAFLFSLSISIAVNSKWLYEAGFEKYDIAQVTGISESELNKAATGIVSYFNNSTEYINVQIVRNGQPYQLFSEDEKQIIHMKDVKTLFRLDYIVLLVSFLYIFCYTGINIWRKKLKDLALGLISGGGLTFALMALLGISIGIGFFDPIFIAFHRMAFHNDFWLLDPNIDVLIMMFPDGFWQDALSFIALLTGAGAIILGAVGGWMVWKKRIY